MKKVFNIPEIEVMHLGMQDVITTSGGNGELPTDYQSTNTTPDW